MDSGLNQCVKEEEKMDVFQKIKEASKILRDVSLYLDDSDLIELEFEIKIKPQRLLSKVIGNEEVGENLPPSK